MNALIAQWRKEADDLEAWLRWPTAPPPYAYVNDPARIRTRIVVLREHADALESAQ